MGILLVRDFSKEAPGFSSPIYGSTIPVDLVEGNITEKRKSCKRNFKAAKKKKKKILSLTGSILGGNQVIDQKPVSSNSLENLLL